MIATEMYRGTLPVTVVFMLWLSRGLPSRPPVQVDVGETAELSCLVDIIGSNIDVEWYNKLNELLTQNNEVMTQDRRFSIKRRYVDEWVLSINNVRNSDAGRYECRIGPYKSHSVELIVSRPPEIRENDISGAGSYVLNSRVNLSCAASGIPEPVISWLRVENHQLIGLNVEGNNYVIDSLNLSTAGVYECHASAKGVKQTATAALAVHVLFAPIIKVPYQEVIQEEGRWTQLSCLVTVNPKAGLYWMRNGRRVDTSGSYVVSSQEIGRYKHLLRLSIEILRYSDFGKYQCLAENEYGKDAGQITLLGERKKKAVVVSRPRDLMVTVGEDALFNCSVLHLSTDDRLVWWHRSANETKKLFEIPSLKHSSKKTSALTVNSLEEAKHDVVGQYNLLIRRANFSDEGLYTCQISEHENLSATLNVIVSKDSDVTCQEYHQEPFNLNAILIVLCLVVIALLLVTIIIIILVCRLRIRRSRKDVEYSPSVQLNAKVVKIDQ